MLKLVTFSIKLIFATVLLQDRKDGVKFWSAVSLLCASLFELTEWIQGLFIPYASSKHWDVLVTALGTVYPVLFFLQETGVPYAFLMTGIVYHGFFSQKALKRFAAILLLPPILSLLTLDDNGLLDLQTPFFLAMTTVYLMLTAALMGLGLIRKRNTRPRNKKIAEAIIIIPNVLALLIFHYASIYVSSWSRLGDTILVVMAVTFILFLIVISRSGMLGIKLRLERQVAANTLRSVTTGTAILNHSIKNRLTNIDLLADRILEQQNVNMRDKVHEDVELIHSESRQVLEMIRRIQHQTEPIALNEQECSLTDIIQDSTAACSLYMSDKKTQISLNLQDETILYGDRVHLKEVIVNLLHNALDALPEQGGTIRISCERSGDGIALNVRDNGEGISADHLRNIMEPFYSTKDRSHNFGLGLTYCNMVVEKHGGSLQIESSKGKGTHVQIRFPSRRIIGKQGKPTAGQSELTSGL
ncbi:sensor histidine kinase [Paenibacillus thalictri]|uniref:histidine kinase n=1 Tax=Paenibacillus thalictri TaxID=2527873 RepID=A0A4Q9DGF9_9BACL|nr:HAMP domain-containing sensor histidine kinase [Paenibacillus thalictri]TBL71237.1 HAMP domain-containing histidine kinase [Paenibacillus thalictri]